MKELFLPACLPAKEPRYTLQYVSSSFIASLLSDMSALKTNKYVYSDLNLRNFMLNSKGDYYWIDTQIKKYSQQDKFKKKFNYSLLRFIDDPLLTLNTKENSVLNSLLIR